MQDPVNTLMVVSVVRYLRTPQQQSLVCCAGTRGYQAFKEMLQRYVPMGFSRYCDHDFYLVESGSLLQLEDEAEYEDKEGDEVQQQASPPQPVLCRILGSPDKVLVKEEHDNYQQLLLAFKDTTHIQVLSNTEQMYVSFSSLPAVVSASMHLPRAQTLPCRLLSNCPSLKSFEITSSMPNLIAFPSSFLHGNIRGLTMLDLTPFEGVSKLPEHFLAGARNLQEVDLTLVSKKTELFEGFLRDCSSLTSLDLKPLSWVVKLGRSFLERCSGLKSIDLSPLSQVTTLSPNFLSGCSGLTTLDLTPFSQVTRIRSSFLENCSGLKSIDLSPLSQVADFEMYFMCGCSGLKEIDVTPFSNMSSVPDCFMFYCTGLKTLDLSSFKHLKDFPPFLIDEWSDRTLLLPSHITK